MQSSPLSIGYVPHSACSSSQSSSDSAPSSPQFPYSLIFKATKLPSLRKLGTNSRIFPLTIHQKDFDAFALGFATEAIQLDVFESLKQCAVIRESAFVPQSP